MLTDYILTNSGINIYIKISHLFPFYFFNMANGKHFNYTLGPVLFLLDRHQSRSLILKV